MAGERELAAQAKVVGRVDQVSNLSIPAMLISLFLKIPFAELLEQIQLRLSVP